MLGDGTDTSDHTAESAMFRRVVVFTALSLLPAGCGRSGIVGRPPAPQDELMGYWVVESAEAFGRPGPTQTMKLEFHQDKATWHFQTRDGWKTFDGMLRFDPKADPKTIDLGGPDRPAGRVAIGIYAFREGRLIISMGAERPKSFDDLSDAKLVLKHE
jgi:uncharacterized protein (TIGR03067 family)